MLYTGIGKIKKIKYNKNKNKTPC